MCIFVAKLKRGVFFLKIYIKYKSKLRQQTLMQASRDSSFELQTTLSMIRPSKVPELTYIRHVAMTSRCKFQAVEQVQTRLWLRAYVIKWVSAVVLECINQNVTSSKTLLVVCSLIRYRCLLVNICHVNKAFSSFILNRNSLFQVICVVF